MRIRILSVFLSLALLFSLLAGFSATAHAAEASGKCGDNAVWSYDASAGTLTISGSGAVQTGDLMVGKLWAPYLEQIRSVVVQPGITELGAYAFVGAKQLQSVSLPDTLTSMIDMVFARCSSLKTIALPDSQHIDRYACLHRRRRGISKPFCRQPASRENRRQSKSRNPAA